MGSRDDCSALGDTLHNHSRPSPNNSGGNHMAKKRIPQRAQARVARAGGAVAPGPARGPARTPVIVTFKPKEQRRDKTDKVQIVMDAISSRVKVYDVTPPPPGVAPEEVALDVNLYEAPIVSLSLTNQEIAALRANPNVALIEDDGLCYGLPEPLVCEGQPGPQAETVPIGVQQVKAPLAWGCSRGRGIRVAILDTGIDAGHPDLAPNVKGAVSFVPGETPADGNSHGTHCAGTIGAVMN